MKRILGVLTFCMLISMTACSSGGAADSATDETSVATVETTAATEGTTAELTEAPTEEITTEPSASVTLTEICNWATADIWNTGFCDISHYIEDGKSSVGQTMDIEFTISNLSVALEKKEKYNDYIMSLDSSSAEIEQLQNAWSKMFEQIDVLYNRVVEETPRPADATYEFDTGLFKQYYDAFYELATSIKEPPLQSTSGSGAATTETENEEGNSLEVDKGLFNVTLTVPANMIDDLEKTKKEAETNEAVVDYKVNDDGSITYTYKKSEYNKMVAEMRSGFDTMVDEQLASGNYTTFSSIVGDDTLENVTLTVTSQQEYEATWDGLIVWGLYIYIGYYQIYSGDAPTENDIKTTFHFVDGTNGTEFDTVIYPDAMQAE